MREICPSFRRLALLTLSGVGLLALPCQAWSGTIGVSDFRSVPGGVFIDLPLNGGPGNVVQTMVVDGITITPFTGFMVQGGAFLNCGGGLSSLKGTAASPGDGAGFCAETAHVPGEVTISSIVFDFSAPVAGFGATFHHFVLLPLDVSVPPSLDFSAPSIVQVFDGPNGTGTQLGIIQDPGLMAGRTESIDFAGLISTTANIRSAVITGTGSEFFFAVDGIAISSPIPEPITGP